jgi:hypothetical protein
MSTQNGAPSSVALWPLGSAVWVVVQYDTIDWTDSIMQPGYWKREHAEKRAERLNARETDSYTYRVKQIEMHSSPNSRGDTRSAESPLGPER